MPNKRVPCKFFAQGGCLKGESCAFSHDQTAPSYNICSFYQKGACSFGSRCNYIHVSNNNDHITDSVLESNRAKPTVIRVDQPILLDLCPSCGKHCLHPYKPQEREEHFKRCNKQKNHLEVLNRSQEVECSVCFERVLSKSTPAERKFGILSECDHPFCVSCIRNWRSSSSRVMDVKSVLRACPICRKVSYFVVPSGVWYSTKEEKEEIVDSYKKKLRSIDCKYFKYGNGTCPFGSSCFYKHIVKEGSNLWNVTLMPDFYDSIYMNCDESDDWLSDLLEDEDFVGTDILTIVSHSSSGDEDEDEDDEDDFSLEEDELNDVMASLLGLGLTDGSIDSSSSGDEGA